METSLYYGLPRFCFTEHATPLEYAPRLSEKLGIKLYIKRDDKTGLVTGGNKVRKLEFLMADAVKKGADVVLTTGSLQSNHAMLTCAAANKLGLEPVLVLKGKEPARLQGNLLLEKLLGVRVHFVDAEEYREVYDFMEEMMADLQAKGRNPYFIPVGGSTPLGAVGYVAAAEELFQQAGEMGLNVDYIVNAVGSGGTSAGLEVGVRLFNKSTRVVGISVDAEKSVFQQEIARIAAGCASLIAKSLDIKPEDVIVIDEYIGEAGYGKPSRAGNSAIELVAACEGIILDPVYSGKAMGGLIDLARQGYFNPGSTVVFFHTGGIPAIFDLLQDQKF
ncbi:1-aminocyclopropane-1-carboxylate deaminase/D-cysteine desulfhydrase [Thermosediminibacter litoriperuensis]|uniref:D-cysteine desulfhydrase n=1 Tax=Thermosediminibacter litoriperuensis TaxID=291989 RepID=A0A5S5AGB7_9FIRM|nr:D-cysteine desulfhydrase family protein [Thermosediminibacter litoriperuensis]TYP49229.1 D-cysteine desulfhydrase [Thermosediminibacter litoriperuensis]